MDEVRQAITEIEKRFGKKFANVKDPLLISVRSESLSLGCMFHWALVISYHILANKTDGCMLESIY